MVGRIGIPPFEFFSMTGELPVKRLFVRDLRQAWYHRGVPDHGASIPEVAESLARILSHQEVDRLVVAGTSAGGYAALVFGTLLGAHKVLCFAPQTVLDLDILAAIGDHRWDERLKRQTAAGGLDPRFIDLRRVLGEARRQATTYQVYFADSLRADRLHCERLSDLRGVRLYRFGHAGHNIARSLRDRGSLGRVLRRALHVPPQVGDETTGRVTAAEAPGRRAGLRQLHEVRPQTDVDLGVVLDQPRDLL